MMQNAPDCEGNGRHCTWEDSEIQHAEKYLENL